MASVGLFFGSDTGNTEHIAKMIQKQLGKTLIDVHDIAKSTKEEIAEFDLLMFGIPTWYYGEAQCDWDDFFPELEEIDFNDKLVGKDFETLYFGSSFYSSVIDLAACKSTASKTDSIGSFCCSCNLPAII